MNVQVGCTCCGTVSTGNTRAIEDKTGSCNLGWWIDTNNFCSIFLFWWLTDMTNKFFFLIFFFSNVWRISGVVTRRERRLPRLFCVDGRHGCTCLFLLALCIDLLTDTVQPLSRRRRKKRKRKIVCCCLPWHRKHGWFISSKTKHTTPPPPPSSARRKSGLAVSSCTKQQCWVGICWMEKSWWVSFFFRFFRFFVFFVFFALCIDLLTDKVQPLSRSNAPPLRCACWKVPPRCPRCCARMVSGRYPRLWGEQRPRC